MSTVPSWARRFMLEMSAEATSYVCPPSMKIKSKVPLVSESANSGIVWRESPAISVCRSGNSASMCSLAIDTYSCSARSNDVTRTRGLALRNA